MKQRLSVPLFSFFLFRTKPNQRTHAVNKLLNHIHFLFPRHANAPVPSYRERVFEKAECFIMQAIYASSGYNLYADPATLYDEQATELLVEAWDELMSVLTSRSDGGVDETNALLEKIRDALNQSANSSAVNARELIGALNDCRPFLFDGAVTGLALLTDLGRAGYRFQSDDIRELIRGLFIGSIRLLQERNTSFKWNSWVPVE